MTWPRSLRSTGVRLALTFSGLFALFSALMIFIIYGATTYYMDLQIDSTIQADVDGLSDVYARRGLPGLIDTINARVSNPLRRSAVYLLADRDLGPVVGNVKIWPAAARDTTGTFEVPLERDGEKTIVRLHHFILAGGHHLLVGRDVDARIDLQHLLRQILIGAMICAVGFAVIVGSIFRILLQKRMRPFTSTAAQVGGGDLEQRVPITGAEDEFDALAESINAMLARIERLMSGIRDVSNSIAHDLRTPLTRVRGRLETIAAAAALSDDARDGAESALREIDGLLQVFGALLRIAEIDAGTRRSAFAQVDLVATLTDVVDLYAVVAEEHRLRLDFAPTPGLQVKGDRHLLAQAVANLIDNAIKFSPPGGVVSVTAMRDRRATVILVADEGPGIPPAERDKVRDRFYRMEASRNSPGSGLGLALVDAVARLHDGTLQLGDNHPGLIAKLILP